MTQGNGFSISGLHHVQLAIPAGGEEACRNVEADFAPARKAHPGILVDGLADLAARLETAGATVTWDTELDGHDRFYSYDPFGNRLEFLAPQPGR